jgi:protein O-mannosyl-transferase
MSRPRFIALLLVLGTLAVYYPAMHHGFTLYDDTDYVTQNPTVENGLTWAGLKWAFTTIHASNWHPLTWLSHMADCQFFGLDAGMHHFVNVLFHTANAVLLFLLLLRLTGSLWPSAFVAALFAWHPMHVESVAWVSERKDVLSTFFGLLSLLFYVRYTKVKSGKRKAESRNQEAKRNRFFPFSILHPPSSPAYYLSLGCFALALMAKAMVVTLPFILLLLDYWPLARTSKSGARNWGLVLEKIPFFAFTVASCVITYWAQHTGGAVASLQMVSLHYRLFNIPLAYTGYLLKLFCPSHLAIIYPMLEMTSSLPAAAATVVLILITAAVWFARKCAPYGLMGWLWFVGTLVPVIGLVQVGGAAMADRYSYFPSIGIFLAVTLGVLDAAERFRVPKAVLATFAVLILGACLALTHRQVGYWRDDVALFSHAVAVTKDNDSAYLNLGYACEKIGRKDLAMNDYREAMKIDPERIEAHNNLANLLDDTGHTNEALAEYQEALNLNPKYVAAHNNLGTMYLEMGRYEDAMKQYQEAAQLDSNDWHAPYLMGKALLKQGRDEEAIPCFKQAVNIDQNNPQILAFLAEVLATDHDSRIRNGPAAFAMADKANALTGGFQPAVLDVLAMTYAELGHFDDAQQAMQDAIKMANNFDMTNDLPVYQERLELYQKHQPFRESFTNAPPKQASGK